MNLNIADAIRGWLMRAAYKVATGTLPVPLVPEWARHAYMVPTFRALCQEGVKANGAVLACVEQLVFSFPEPKLKIWQEADAGLQPLLNHPAYKLLLRPNPQMGMAELLCYTILYESIGGNCYWYKVRSQARRVVELWPLNDSQITPVAGGETLISHYEWETGEGQPRIIPAADIVHFKWMPDPLQPWRGLAPLMAVARDVDTDNAAARYVFTLLKNDAIPRVVIIAAQNARPPEGSDRDRFNVQWQEKYGGDNRGAFPMWLGNTADVKTLSLNLEQLAFDALRRVPEARIAGAFRVPPVLAGLNVGLEMMTYSNLEGSRRHMAEATLTPLWRAVADEVATDLLPEFGDVDGLTAAFDLSTVAVLQENQAALRTWVVDAVTKSVITRNEGRAKLGLPPDVGGDVYLQAPLVTLVPAQLAAPTKAKALPLPPERKASREERRKLAMTLIAAQREQRRMVAARLEPALENFFGGLADRVIGRALKGWERGEQKIALLEPDDLITDSDSEELLALVKRFYLELIQLSWDTWNLSLGVTTAFDLIDPAVTKALESAGVHIKAINETTLAAVRDALTFASENGWSIDRLVEGDRQLGKPGLRDIVEQTYKGRAETIARTEIGHCQQVAAMSRYTAAGVDRVLVLDNGFDDSAPGCVVLGAGGKGTIMSASWANSHVLGHPRCVRAFAAMFPDDGPIDEATHAAWQSAGGDSPAIGGS